MKLITRFFIKNVSETHNLNNPTQGTQCGTKKGIAQNWRLGETRPFTQMKK